VRWGHHRGKGHFWGGRKAVWRAWGWKPDCFRGNITGARKKRTGQETGIEAVVFLRGRGEKGKD